MVTRSLMVIVVCFGFPIIIQTLLPKAMALRKAPNVDEYMIEDRRTHRRHNYVVQRGLDDETSGKIDNRGPIYETESFEPETSPEELPELIVDYANMIRNDIILLDNSVETRTRKRGNIKKYNQAIPDPPCSCESIYDTKTLGSNFYPEVVPTWKCNDNNESKCPPPYRCKETYYQISVLRSKENPTEKSPVTLPPALRSRADTMRKLAKCDLKYDEMKKLAKCEQLYTKDDSDRTARIGTPFTSFQRN